MTIQNITKFPSTPFDGMKFTDKWRRRWVFNASNNSWQFIGFLPDIPIADNQNVGLLSPRMKAFIDSVKPKSGSFGIVLKNNFGKTHFSDYSNVLSGNIKLKSNSLRITCSNPIGQTEFGVYPSIDINFSEDFLNGLCIEVPGEKGPKGRKGADGDDGDPGTGDGPKGQIGDPGNNATELLSVVDDVEVIFDDGFYDYAVTDVILDPERSILSVTRSEALVPTENTPANEVVALSASRDVEFTDEDSLDYRITKPQSAADPFDDMPMDMTLLAYPSDYNPDANRKFIVGATGCCCEEADFAAVVAVNLSDYIDLVISKYQQGLAELNEEYDREVREYIFKKDEEARKALDVLVQKLSHEQFTEGFEYCMNLVENGVCGQQCCNEISKMRQDPYNNPGSFTNSTIQSMACGIIEQLAQMSGNSENNNGDVESFSLTSGDSKISNELYNNTTDSYGIATLSENAPDFSELCDNVDTEFNGVPTASQFNQFSFGICVFAQQILSNSGFVTTSEDFCPDSESKNIRSIRLKPGDQVPITSDVGPTLKPGAYILQYKSGTIYDSDQPTQGNVVGTGSSTLGLVLTVFKANGNNSEYIIPWPRSSISSDPFCAEEVQQSYLIGPITEIAVGAIIEEGDRMVLEAVVTGNNSKGEIEVSINHCSRCIS